ncbi:MAG: dienelactone hydrolase family protein, partial [Alphaproteobacteria bacterium]|nr:dienelactone hydrolase family protein [Alphaproteobacteria bacterium]
GAIGFCVGGGVVNQLAVRMGDALNAAVPFYGGQPTAADAAKIKAPVNAQYGEQDKRITDGWPAFDAALTEAHVPHEGHVYQGANHGFHNDTTPRYDEAAAKEAWQRTLDWFNKYLRA